MPFSLFDATVPQYNQLLYALDGLLDKARAWCDEGHPESVLLESRLTPDMLPFAYQVKAATHHSAGAILGVRKGSFSPMRIATPDNLHALQKRVKNATATCKDVTRKEVNGWVGSPMRFTVRGHTRHYTAEHFLMSFSQPNFYFHLTTAYALLRVAGLPVGKKDYLGALQTKEATS
jgi:hypothetical protein